MKKFSKIKLLLASMLSVALMFSSVMPAAAAQYDISAKLSGPNTDSHQVMLDPTCFLYGYASCESGTGLGHICLWVAKQTGSEPFAGTNTAASFGSEDSFTNIMGKSYMVTTYPTTLHEYEKTANLLHIIRRPTQGFTTNQNIAVPYFYGTVFCQIL